MGEFVPETCRADLKKINKRKFCILLVAYVVDQLLLYAYPKV